MFSAQLPRIEETASTHFESKHYTHLKDKYDIARKVIYHTREVSLAIAYLKHALDDDAHTRAYADANREYDIDLAKADHIYARALAVDDPRALADVDRIYAHALANADRLHAFALADSYKAIIRADHVYTLDISLADAEYDLALEEL